MAFTDDLQHVSDATRARKGKLIATTTTKTNRTTEPVVTSLPGVSLTSTPPPETYVRCARALTPERQRCAAAVQCADRVGGVACDVRNQGACRALRNRSSRRDHPRSVTPSRATPSPSSDSRCRALVALLFHVPPVWILRPGI
ncbi:hypothetical protein KC19_5G020800 [Ceratodon purpureus]|uniref:Uncharacterized protein n=1 Tax=Ceratodon purpureus TaxID=3225 RepID=A0A8T0HX01_CERPU|nr:hypothetical protein KC19_5G020800 [Ceratodon purpureus]